MTSKTPAWGDSLTLAMARRIDAARDDFEAALRSGGRPRIEDYLVRLEREDRSHALAELLLLECEYLRGLGEEPQVDEYRSRFPGDAALIDGAFGSTFDRGLPDAAATDRDGCPEDGCHEDGRREDRGRMDVADADRLPLVIGDYELLELIASGGMGAVYKARQRRLGRIVAVKVIRAAQFASREDIDRFSVEAAAAAQLQHPGIVALHEVGEQDGVRFFSMEYVDGQSLAQRLAEGTFAARPAAALVAAVADAVQFAHQRGVVHRDLKPSNILLDRDKRPRVVDFGLAKRIDADSGLTQSGQILGTPSYMPPEQASGGTRIDGRGDVYALGAVLYEMLAGRAPFRGENALETIRQVSECEPAAPRVLNASIPRDLETICLKCLEKSPDGRYATAAQLADDLRRFERGEPVRARPLGRLQRALRWRQRNPLVAGLSAAVALTLVLGAAASAWFAIDARRQAAEAARQAESFRAERDRADFEAASAKRHEQIAASQRDRAREALADARRAIDKYVDTVRDADLLREERFKPLLNELLADALVHYQRYIDKYANDPSSRADLARALNAVGSLSIIRGDIERARSAFSKAIEMSARADQTRATPDELATLAEAHRGVAVVELETSGLAASATALHRAMEIYENLASRGPAATAYRHELARLHRLSGSLLRRKGDMQGAAGAYRIAVSIEEQLVASAKLHADSSTAAASFRAELAYDLNMLGNTLADLGQPLDALEQHSRAIEVARLLVNERPLSVNYREVLAKSHGGRGRSLSVRGDSAAAATAFGKAIAIQRTLVAEQPTVHEYRDSLVANLVNLGNEQQHSGEFSAAAASYGEAAELAARLAVEQPTVARYRESLAKVHANLGLVQKGLGQFDSAAASLARSIALFDALAAESPENGHHRADLAKGYCNLGTIQTQRGDAATAATTLQNAIRILETLADEQPRDRHASILASSYHQLAIAQRAQRHFAESAGFNARAAEVYDRLVAANPSIADYRQGAAMCRLHLGIDHKALGKPTEAAMALSRAIDMYGALAAADPDVDEYRAGLAGGLVQLGDLHLQTNRASSALELFGKAVAIYAQLVQGAAVNVEHRFNLGAGQILCAKALSRMGNREGAIESLTRACEVLETLSTDHPAVDRYGAALADARAELAEVQRQRQRRRQRAAAAAPTSP
jgi:tetratricopeptide (TPR) repeat protein/tRNA A-37 threonylcarbamoyl transferase component Bud32